MIAYHHVSHPIAVLALGKGFTFLACWLPGQVGIPLYGASQMAEFLFNDLQRPRGLELEGILPPSSSLPLCYSIKLPSFVNLKSKIDTSVPGRRLSARLHVKIVYVYGPRFPTKRKFQEHKSYSFFFPLCIHHFENSDYRLN